LAIDAVDDIDDRLDIALWSAAAAAPILHTSTVAARGKTGNFMTDLLLSRPRRKNNEMQTKFR
jgi:molybdopterin/thiamine biosynthesis adenylyltransferase